MNLGVDITGNGIAIALAGDKITLINHWMDINTSSFLLLITESGGMNAAVIPGSEERNTLFVSSPCLTTLRT